MKASQVTAWIKRQNKSGNVGLALLHNALAHAHATPDWTPLGYMVGKTQPAIQKIARIVVAECWPGVVITNDKDQPCGVSINRKKAAPNPAAMAKLDALVKQGAAIGGKAVADAFKVPKKEKAAEPEAVDETGKAEALETLQAVADEHAFDVARAVADVPEMHIQAVIDGLMARLLPVALIEDMRDAA